VWYKNLDRYFFRFVTIHACDRQTDRILIAIPRLYYMQRGKKLGFINPFNSPDTHRYLSTFWILMLSDTRTLVSAVRTQYFR